MRSMAIGLRFCKPEQINNLVLVALEAARTSHSHPIGYVGAVAVAAFVRFACLDALLPSLILPVNLLFILECTPFSYAIQSVPLMSWGAKIRDEVFPLCRAHVAVMLDRQPSENITEFPKVESVWCNGTFSLYPHSISNYFYSFLSIHSPNLQSMLYSFYTDLAALS